MGIMKGLFLTVLAVFVASCQMRTLLVRTGSAESSDYKDSRPKPKPKPKDFCKRAEKIVTSLCSTPEDRKRDKCVNLKKTFENECGSGASDYQNIIGGNQNAGTGSLLPSLLSPGLIPAMPHNLGGGTNIIGGNQNAFGGGNKQTSIG